VQLKLTEYLSVEIQMSNTKKTPKRRKRYKAKIDVITVRPIIPPFEKRGARGNFFWLHKNPP
jgi:hypothetical protein